MITSQDSIGELSNWDHWLNLASSGELDGVQNVLNLIGSQRHHRRSFIGGTWGKRVPVPFGARVLFERGRGGAESSLWVLL